MLKIKKILVCLCLTFCITGCITGSAERGAMKVKPEFSTWLAYWDLPSGERELKKTARQLTSLSYFAAYFDADGHAFIPQELTEAWQRQQKKRPAYTSYLTFVNDKIDGSGRTLLKDTDFLMELWQDADGIDAHVEELISLTKAGGFGGLEIDYERLWRGDKLLPERFLAFTYRLALRAQEEDLKLRIVLEPSADFAAAYCRGPEYVVMLYNLFGTHSEAGPKADFAFLAAKASQMKSLPGEPVAALATGGCQWGSDGSRRFISEAEAAALVKEYKPALRRDAASAAVVFEYMQDDISYEVWYADKETLRAWSECAADNGLQKVSLWRLGSNVNIHKVL